MALLAHPAVADIFARLSGSFGVPDLPEESCEANPVFSTFSQDNRRVTFTWEKPVASYTGAMIRAYSSTVVTVEPHSLTLLRDDETRRDPAGKIVLWQMRETTTPDGYCWHRLDWPETVCLPQVRCPPSANS